MDPKDYETEDLINFFHSQERSSTGSSAAGGNILAAFAKEMSGRTDVTQCVYTPARGKERNRCSEKSSTPYGYCAKHKVTLQAKGIKQAYETALTEFQSLNLAEEKETQAKKAKETQAKETQAKETQAKEEAEAKEREERAKETQAKEAAVAKEKEAKEAKEKEAAAKEDANKLAKFQSFLNPITNKANTTKEKKEEIEQPQVLPAKKVAGKKVTVQEHGFSKAELGGTEEKTAVEKQIKTTKAEPVEKKEAKTSAKSTAKALEKKSEEKPDEKPRVKQQSGNVKAKTLEKEVAKKVEKKEVKKPVESEAEESEADISEKKYEEEDDDETADEEDSEPDEKESETESYSRKKTKKNFKPNHYEDDQNVQVKLKRNKFGNFEHSRTGIVFDLSTKKAYGMQHPNGRVYSLGKKERRFCRENNWPFMVRKRIHDESSSESSDEESEESCETDKYEKSSDDTEESVEYTSEQYEASEESTSQNETEEERTDEEKTEEKTDEEGTDVEETDE